MQRKNGDYFRTVRFGGFHKTDVMQYIETLETRLHAQQQQTQVLGDTAHDMRAQWLRALREVRVLRRRVSQQREFRQQLQEFQQQLLAAQALTDEIERENVHLRKRIRLLEEPLPPEQEGMPLEQLTFKLFLDDLDEDPLDLTPLLESNPHT
ncbi:MAG: hypothetical protein LBB67_06855 [Oscillospiraceae bacterium]|nr:hypothetical protein [Oscillospiraceae bacterium]